MRKTWILIVMLLLASVGVVAPSGVQARGGDYFIDCAGGSDSAAGTSESKAWRSLKRVDKATLEPGGRLLLKAGCRWNGQRLIADWDGTGANPITITGYGNGDRPEIRNATVMVTGAYIIVDGLSIDHDIDKADKCGQPLGQYYGIAITRGGHHITVRNNIVQHQTAGLHISRTAGNNNTVTNNVFANNNVMQEPFNGKGDLGAWGVLVRRDNNEFAHNTFENNRAVCRKAKYIASNSIEFYEAAGNSVHHNYSVNDRVFSELGSSKTRKAADNYFAFNVHVSNIDGARFITTRGAKDTQYGPVNRTVAERNTVRYTGDDGEGLVCSQGCTPAILTARYNILDTTFKSIYFDDTMGQESNLIWSSTGTTRIQDGGRLRILKPGTHTDKLMVADPRFGNTTTLTLNSDSPAIDNGGHARYTIDHNGTTITNTPDLGAHEYIGSIVSSNLVAQSTMINNGGFEVRDASGDLDQWTAVPGFSATTDSVHSGDVAGRHRANDNRDQIVKTLISDVDGTQRYRVSGWVKIPKTKDTFDFRVQVQWRNDGNNVKTETVANWTESTSGWTKFEAVAVAPSDATTAQLMMNARSLNGIIDVDDFAFEAGVTT